jgi:UTP-glucose-1-phosphate uridylyltransferase
MLQKPTLLILAGGLASRYGAVKQMETVGPSGESILDYSVYDAIQSGFGKVVFVLNKAIAKDFVEKYNNLFADKISVDYVIQHVDDLPEGFQSPENRQKPWGTGHAVRAARNAIHEPFVVINADDFYGQEAYAAISTFLSKNDSDYAMYAYKLGNTLSKHGTVSRGVCEVLDNQLIDINENTAIARVDDGSIKSDQRTDLKNDTLVSMNFWAFQPNIFPIIETLFQSFIAENCHSLTAEFYIPTVVQHVIEKNIRPIDVLSGNSPWFGMTYKSDRDETKASVAALVERNIYPSNLWK